MIRGWTGDEWTHVLNYPEEIDVRMVQEKKEVARPWWNTFLNFSLQIIKYDLLI